MRMIVCYRLCLGFMLMFAGGFSACIAQNHPSDGSVSLETPGSGQSLSEIAQYMADHADNGLPSKAIGPVSNGKLVNGKLFPFAGENFRYFDTLSYLSDRAFMHGKVKQTLLDCYKALSVTVPDKIFYVMEAAHESGGKLHPHRTHQNGLSVDLMTPMLRDGRPCADLDLTGGLHYLLEFDDQGKFIPEPAITIDFDLVARQILMLEKSARENGLKIQKVIFKTELKPLLFATPHGKQLKESGIYFAQKLSPLINSLHDDHFHVDFMLVD